MTYVSISPLRYVYFPLHHLSSQQPYLSFYMICAPISWCSDHVQHQKLNTKQRDVCNSRHLENNEAFTAIYGYSYSHVYKDYVDIIKSITNKCQSDSCLLLYFEIYLKKRTAMYRVGNGDCNNWTCTCTITYQTEVLMILVVTVCLLAKAIVSLGFTNSRPIQRYISPVFTIFLFWEGGWGWLKGGKLMNQEHVIHR